MNGNSVVANLIPIGQGGRLRRSAVGVMTFAPALAMKLLTAVSSLGLGAVATSTILAGEAIAQCNWHDGNTRWECTGTQQISSHVPIDITSASDARFIFASGITWVTDPSSGNAFTMKNRGTGGIIFQQAANGNNITGADNGLDARNFNGGNITVTTTGLLEAKNGFGLLALNYGDGNNARNVTVNVKDVKGTKSGAWIANRTVGGQITFSSNGTITSTNNYRHALYVGGGSSTIITVNANNISARATGLRIRRFGASGTLSVTVSGTIRNVRSYYNAVDVITYEGNAAKTLTLNNVSGARDGVYVKLKEAVDFTLTATGTVHAVNRYGINFERVQNDVGSSTITVSAVRGLTGGIVFREHRGHATASKEVSITASDHVQATSLNSGDGIFVQKTGNGDVTLRTKAVTGGREGIRVKKYDAGSVDISVSGDVEGKCGAATRNADCRDWDDTGIYAYTDQDTTDLDIEVTSAGSVRGSIGIHAYHGGDGVVNISTNGEIHGDGDKGIYVYNFGADNIDNEPAVKVTVDHVDAVDDGIYVKSNSRGFGGTEITINESGSVAGEDAIYVLTEDRGHVKITVGENATVSSEQNLAIGVAQEGRGGNITITSSAGSMISSYNRIGVGLARGDDAIYLFQKAGTGTISVNLSGNVKATGHGIKVRNETDSVTTITSNGEISGATGGAHGIYVNNIGDGAVNITVSGDITGGGTLDAFQLPPTTRISYEYQILTGTRYVGSKEIVVSTTRIKVETQVPGTTIPARVGYALSLNSITSGTKASGTGAVTVTVNSGTISASTGFQANSGGGAILNGSGNSTFTFKSGSTLNGKVSLGAGVDTIVFDGGTVTSGTIFDGGANPTGANNWDSVRFKNNAKSANSPNGVLTLGPTNFVNIERIYIDTGITWKFNGTTTFDATHFISNDGTLSMQDGAAGDVLNIDGTITNQSGQPGATQGVFAVDVDFITGNSDVINLTGTATNVLHRIAIADISANSTAPRTTDEIVVLTISGGNLTNGISFANNQTEFDSGGNKFTLQFKEASGGNPRRWVLVGSTPTTLEDCEEGSTSGVFVCDGNIDVSENMVKSGTINISVTLDDSATVNVTEGAAFRMQGGGGITFTQETGGGTISATTASSTGVVEANSTGTGAGDVEITLVGPAVLEGNGKAIYAKSRLTGDVTISVANVTASHASATAIEADGAGSAVAVTAATVSAGKIGIKASTTNDTGTISITTTGLIQVGAGGQAIDATTKSGALTIVTAGITAGYQSTGIKASATGTGSISITNSGNISVDAGVGIDTYTAGGSTTIILNGGEIKPTSSTDPSAVAIRNDEGNSTITVNSGATIGAHVRLGMGTDTLTFNGGTINTTNIAVELDGGSDGGGNTWTDVLNFSGTTTTPALDASKITNWENINVSAGATVKFNGANTLTTTTLNLAGSLSMQDDEAGDALTLSGNLTGGGKLLIDVNFSSGVADVLNVGGNVTGTYVIEVEDETPSDQTARTAAPINLVVVTGTVTGSQFTFASVKSGNTRYSIQFNATTKTFFLEGISDPLRCVEQSTAGVFICSGTIRATENIFTDNPADFDVTLDDATTVRVSGGVAFNLFGTQAVTFAQESGGLAINATGSATGVVRANTTGSGDVSVTLTGTANLEGAGVAIAATTTNTGNVSITAATVVAANQRATAIRAVASGGNIVINSSGNVTGGQYGVYAKNNGTTGSVSVTVGAIGSVGGYGVHARNNGAGGLTISTGSINAAKHGIDAGNKTSGDVLITVNGPIAVSSTSGSYDGISVDNEGSGGVTVNSSGAVTGADDGIDVVNQGGGSIAITASGTISAAGDGDSNAGIFAQNDSSGENISITTDKAITVSGKHGIYIDNEGSGAITLNNSGVISGDGDHGIYIFQAGTTITATVRRVVGEEDGVRIKHEGSGSATLTVVQGGSISATKKGVHATSSGAGDIMLDISGAVTGESEQGIYAYQSGAGSISISVLAVGGAEEGIEAKNVGSGTITISATGAITSGDNHDGVLAYDNGTGGVTVTVSSINGGDDGLEIMNKAGGDISATINGEIDTEGRASANTAVYIYNDNNQGNITVAIASGAAIRGGTPISIKNESDGDITLTALAEIRSRANGASNGLEVSSKGGDIDITISGSVYGRTNAIVLTNTGTGATKLSLQGGSVSSSGGVAIIQNGGSSNITIGNGTTIRANVRLGEGVDVLTFSGATAFADYSSRRTFDGGTDSGTDSSKDVISFVGHTGAIDLSKLINWEVFELGAGTSITMSSSTTVAFEEVRLSGGTISVSDNTADDILTISGNLTSGGGFVIDTNIASGVTDTITITGNMTGQHVLTVNDISPANATDYTDNIAVMTVSGSTVSANALVLRNTPRFGSKIFRVSFDSSTKTFSLVAADGNLLCVQDTNTSGTFVCNGTIANSENMIVDPGINVVTTLDASATVNVQAFVAFNLEGEQGVSFTQAASGNAITGTASSLGLVHAFSKGSGDHNVVISINGDATFAGSGTAISATASGTGDVTVTTGKVTASNAEGMSIVAMGKGDSVSVTANDLIVGGNGGIMAKNTSETGTVTVTASSTVTSTTGTAIDAYGMGASVTVNASAAVTGGTGIKAVNKKAGSGAATVAVNASAAVAGNTGDGIYAYNKGEGGITITANSTVTGKAFGIHAVNHTSGDIQITVSSSVTGEAGSTKDGIGATDKGGGSITILAGAVTGDDDGIDADNAGGGSVSVTVSGNVLGRDGFDAGSREGAGITIENDASGIDSTLTVQGAFEVTGGYGVYIKHKASGAVSVTSTDEITGTATDGIYVLNEGTTTTITAATVLGEKRGINVKHKGNGDISISSNGSVTGTTSGGIEVEQTATANVEIVVAAVTGGNDGIRVKTSYAGNVTVTATGAIAGSTSQGDGIYVNQSGIGNVSITAIGVVGAERGIDARNYTGGSITVTAQGAVGATATGAKDAGIFTYDDVNGSTILVTVQAGASSQGNYGIYSYSKGSGSLTVNASGAVTGTGKTGIHVNKLNSGPIVVTVDDVTGAAHGIMIKNLGFGLTNLTVNGDVEASGDNASHGIMFSGGTNAGNVTIDLKTGSTVTGKVAGIDVSSSSAGDIAVTSSAAISGGTDGIRLTSEGTGDISLTLSGNVVAGSEGVGIDTKVSTGTATIILNAGTIGGKTSIKNNNGTSVTTVNGATAITGDVMLGGGVDTLTFAGTAFNSAVMLDGGEDVGADSSVDVLNFNAGTIAGVATNLVNWERIVVANGVTLTFVGGTQTLNAGEISLAGTLSLQDAATNDVLTLRGNLAGGSGNSNASAISIDVNLATGDADSLTIQGNLAGTNTLNVADVSPANNRTRVTTPITVVSVTGTAVSSALSLPGGRLVSAGYIYELNFDSTTKVFTLVGKRGTLLCASANAVVGQFSCAGNLTTPENITASGTESVSATLAASATVRVTDDIAFRVSSQSSTTFTQAAGGAAINAVDSAYGVVRATSSGSGNVSVTLTGTASLQGSGTAVEASSTGTGQVTVVVASVQANHVAGTGVRAQGNGSQVSVRASAVSGGAAGVIARNEGTLGGTVSVNVTGAVTSSGTAINAYNRSGNVTVNAGAAVTATAIGVMATNSGGNGNVSVVTTGAVTSSGGGIQAHNMGSGTITVNAAGAVSASGTVGIDVMAGETAGAVTVTAGAVSGQQTAVKINHARDGAIDVRTTGAVSSQQSSAIAVVAAGTGAVSVVANGTVTGGSQGAAIDVAAHGSSTTIVLNSGVTISAVSGIAIANDHHDSSVTVNTGATVSGTIALGGGVDTLTLGSAAFGRSVLDGGIDQGDTDTSVDVLTINGGTFQVFGRGLINWESIVLGAAATGTVDGSRTLVADNISLQGAFSLVDRVANDSLNITGNLAGGGMLKVDVDFFIGSADTVVITGNVTGSTTIDVSDISLRAGGNEDESITIVTVNGEASADAFNLINDGFTAGEYQYTLTYNSTATTSTYSLSRKESVGSVMLVAAPIALFDGFARLPTMQERRAAGEIGQRGWSRLISTKNTYGDAPVGRAEYEVQNTGLQVGFELAEQVGPSGTWVYGVTAQYNKVDGDVTAVTTTGTLTAEGYGIGGTATWYGAAGAYVDIQGQYNIISTDFVVGDNVGALINGEDASSVVLGVEIGKRHEINDKFSVLSSGQMSWGRVDVSDFVTANSQPVKFGGDDSGISARFGAQVDYAYSNEYQGYVLANVHYDTYDSWDITFVNSKYEDSVAPVMGEIGLGGSMELSPEATIYLQAGYKKSFGEEFEDRDSTSITAGVRWSW